MKLDLTPQQPRLRALRVQLIETEEGVIIKRGRTELKILGEGAAEVVRTILASATSEGMTRDELCELFGLPDRPAIDSFVRQLEARRILVPGDGTVSEDLESSLDIFYWHFNESAEQVAGRLNDRRIAIVGVNHVSRQLTASLAASGMENVEVVDYPLLGNLRLFGDDDRLLEDEWSLEPPISYEEWASELDPQSLDCLVATSDFGGQQSLRVWNEFCIKHERHFLPVVLQDMIGYVGPLVVPGETACLECLRARQNSQMDDPASRRAAESAAFEGQVVAGFHPAMASILGDIAALELSRFYGGWMRSRMAGTLIEVNLLGTQMTTRKVLKVPRCQVCSTLNLRSSVSVDKNVFMPGQEVRT